MEIKSQVQTQLVVITFLPESSGVEHHDGHLLGIGILGVILDPFEELLDQGVPGVDLQGLLLVEVVDILLVLALGVGLVQSNDIRS